MLLKTYKAEISRPGCRPEAQTLLCIAHLDQDVGAAISPYKASAYSAKIFLWISLRMKCTL